MNTIKAFYLSFLAIFLCSCSSMQNTENSRFQSGKCYAKSLMPQVNEVYYSDAYAIYTGNEEDEDVEIEIIEVILKPSTSRWVKKKADKNCLSPNPDDCMVWCSVIEPAITEQIKVLKDTTQSDNFEFRQLFYKETADPENQRIEWVEVLCDNSITPKVVTQIKTILKKEGYFIDLNTKGFDTETRKALRAYQEKNDLPQGNLDLETLDVMGIVIN